MTKTMMTCQHEGCSKPAYCDVQYRTVDGIRTETVCRQHADEAWELAKRIGQVASAGRTMLGAGTDLAVWFSLKPVGSLTRHFPPLIPEGKIESYDLGKRA